MIPVSAQARVLKRLTGLSLPKCRRILAMVDLEFSRHRVMTRRQTISLRQAELDEQPADDATIAQGFAELRRMLEEVQP
jgi:hypothetical protein